MSGMLDADEYIGYGNGSLPAVRHAFNAASKEDMGALGRAFAEAAFDRPRGVLRIGITGVQDSGKTVFVNGMLDTVTDKVKKEEANDKSALQPQALWHSESAGWIRQYDAGFDSAGTCLPSYFKNITAPYAAALTDIVEHPQRDLHDRKFDYLVLIAHRENRWKRDDPRSVTVVSDLRQPQTQGMRRFLEKASALKAGG